MHHIFLLMTVLIIGCQQYSSQGKMGFLKSSSQGASGRTGKATIGNLEVKVTASGQVQPARRTTIKAPYTGFVQKLHVVLGQRIQAGQPLLRIGESSEVDQAPQSFPMRAPFAGTIVELNVSEGQQVQANAGPDELKSILTIEDLSSFEAAIEIAELDVSQMKVGMAAKIKIAALPDRVFQGKLSRLNLSARRESSWSSSKVIFPAAIKFDEFDERLRPGMTALIDVIVTRREKTLILGHEFIQGDGEKFFVTKLDGKRADITLGAQNETHAEVLTGLADGDEVRLIDFINLRATQP
jgi:multidrug efflux pump subunit AcrA (membrane-fusion protein)